jgi:DNA phosphorothioation-dependent restriction protein DptH
LDFSDLNRRFVYLVHQYSDWVLTLDRNLGLEYFDGFNSPASTDQPIYLLDHTPEYLTSDGERLLLTTRSTSEIIRLVQPSLQAFHIPFGQGQEELFLNTLRSLSGKLVLKLLSSYTHREEVTGLVFAQFFLRQYGLLQNRFVIPLDAHSELFTTAQRESTLEQEISLKRTDLALVEIDPKIRQVHLRLVEQNGSNSSLGCRTSCCCKKHCRSCR